MQGQLIGEPVSVSVATECAHCSEPIRLHIGSDARARVIDSEAEPLTFVPDVDFSTLPDKCITDAF